MAPRTGVAVVTGAGSGIGRDFARALLAAGWSVALIGRRAAALEETAAGHAALVLPLDVADAAAVEAGFARVADRFGRVDLLFNNAGTFAGNAPFDEMTDEGWRLAIDTNLSGAFYCARAAFRLMKAQSPRGGRIVNNGSIAAQVPRPNAAGYTASKHGVTGLTRQIALDGRDWDIACTQIDIGNAATELARGFAEGALQPDGRRMPEPQIDPGHVTDALMYISGLPLSATVLQMTLMATRAPFVGRG